MKPWIIVLLRSISIFFLTLFLIRIMGKVNLSKTTPFKFVSYIVIAIIASLMSLGLIQNIIFGFISLAVWIVFSIALDYLSIKSNWVHDFINGRETILIKDSKIMEENLQKVRYTGEELLRDLRSKNAFNMADVEFAVMESTGELNILLKSDKKPVTAHDLKTKVATLSEPETVILDGTVLDEHLANRGLSREWLNSQLSNYGVSIDNVFIGQVDSSGDLFIDLFDDMIQVQQPQVKELLYATISQVQADLLTFSLETNDPKAKQMYSENANKIKAVMEKLEPHLLR